MRAARPTQERFMGTTRTSKLNGATIGHGTLGVDVHRVRERADKVTASASGIARIADAVWEGAEAQVRALDSAVAGMTAMTTSLRDTATQAESVSSSVESLVSSSAEL